MVAIAWWRADAVVVPELSAIKRSPARPNTRRLSANA